MKWNGKRKKSIETGLRTNRLSLQRLETGEHDVLLVCTVLFTVYCFVFWSIVDSFWVSGKSCPSQTPSICLFFLCVCSGSLFAQPNMFIPFGLVHAAQLQPIQFTFHTFSSNFVFVFDGGACSMLLFRCCSILMLSEKHATLLFSPYSVFVVGFGSLSRYLLPIKYSKAIVRWPCIENRILKRVCVCLSLAGTLKRQHKLKTKDSNAPQMNTRQPLLTKMLNRPKIVKCVAWTRAGQRSERVDGVGCCRSHFVCV